MLGYIGKVLFFMVLAFPVTLGLHVLAGLPDWSMLVILASLGVIGRETFGRRIDRMDEEGRSR